MNEQEISREIAIENQLKDQVKNFTSEQIQAREKEEHIKDTFYNGLNFISQTVEQETGFWRRIQTNVTRLRHGLPRLNTEEIVASWVWPIDDVARSFLTKPLPKQAFQYEAGELDEATGLSATPELIEKARVADKVGNWWAILSPDQKNAFSKVIGLDLTVGERYQPEPHLENKPHILLQGPLIRFGEDGQRQAEFYPVVVWQGEGAYGLSALPRKVEQTFHNRPLNRVKVAVEGIRGKLPQRINRRVR